MANNKNDIIHDSQAKAKAAEDAVNTKVVQEQVDIMWAQHDLCEGCMPDVRAKCAIKGMTAEMCTA